MIKNKTNGFEYYSLRRSQAIDTEGGGGGNGDEVELVI